jgi:CRISP-associated protein Cas1
VRVLNTLYVTEHRMKLSVRDKSIEVRDGRTLVGRYPMHGLDAILVTGRAELTNEAIGRCVQEGVRIAALSKTGRLRFAIGGSTRGNVLLRVTQAQASVDQPTSLAIATVFVAGKLQNQRRNLLRWTWDCPDERTKRHIERQRIVVELRLKSLPGSADGDQLRGYEGDAARRYFKGLGAHVGRVAEPLSFETRNRRPPRDPVNALFSYLYGLLTVEAVGSLDAVGLDPQIGFLHQVRPGRPSLALDLIEEFRPVVERFAVGTLARRQIQGEHFETSPGGACSLTDDGRRVLLKLWEQHRSQLVVHPLLKQEVTNATLLTIQATLLARHLRGDLSTYAPYIQAS